MWNTSGCTTSVNGGLGEPQPLLLKPNGTDYDAFYLPEDNSGTISFAVGEVVNVACPGSYLAINSVTSSYTIAAATCVSGSTFSIAGTQVPFINITCTSYPWHTAQYTGNTCATKYKEIEVGFEVEDRFLVHMLICYDDTNQNTLWSYFNLTKTIGGFQTGFPRPSFIQGAFYSVGSTSVNTLYTRATQRVTINNLLGLNESDYTYIAETSNYYMARGHLTAKADFVFGAAHRLTFWFVNIAPQWQTFNGGNWNTLEQNVRTYASNQYLDYYVYTGTYGIATLPHASTGQEVELYLYVDSNNNKGLPVPAIYWKFLYEPISKAGIVFIGVNNPYQASKNAICTDVSSKISWLTWSADSQSLGYSYACEVSEFRKLVDYFPDLEVTSLLT